MRLATVHSAEADGSQGEVPRSMARLGLHGTPTGRVLETIAGPLPCGLAQPSARRLGPESGTQSHPSVVLYD
jgi:hypothetical protein